MIPPGPDAGHGRGSDPCVSDAGIIPPITDLAGREERGIPMVCRFSSTTPIVGLIVLSLAMLLPAPGDAGGDLSSPLFSVTVPEGYRQWEVVAPSHRTDKDEIRVILGNDLAMKAYRAGTLPFPDGSILAKPAWTRVKSAEVETAFGPREPQRIE